MMKPFQRSICRAALFIVAVLGAKEGEDELTYWLTGPLIAPVGTALPYGHFLLKSYLSCTADTCVYNQHWNAVPEDKNLYRLSFQGFYFFGLTSTCDIQVVPRLFYNIISDKQYVHPGDLTVGLDFQLMGDEATPYFPGIKFSIKEIFPTGNFQNLSPRKLTTDQTGMGTFGTELNLVLYKVFHLYGVHWLSTTFSGEYTVNTPVNVHGFNAYGGGFGTSGTALPGNRFQAIMSFEFTLNQNWALALDSVYTHTEMTQFFGFDGIMFGGVDAVVGGPSSEQFGLAPAIEYNFSKQFGMIAGCFFSAAGKNRIEFRSGVINFNYAY